MANTCRRRMPGDDIHNARLRPDFCNDSGRPARCQQRAAAAVISDLLSTLPFWCRGSSRQLLLHHRARRRSPIRAHPTPRGARLMPSIRHLLGARRLGWLLCGIGALGVACYLFPVYWMLISGLKTSAQIFANPPSLIPIHATLDAYRHVFEHENVARYMRNRLAIAIPVTVVTLILGSSGSYALSRLRSPLVDIALVIALILQIFPDALLATPMFIMFRHFNLLNTFTSVVLATSSKSLAFALVILRPMYRQVPIEIE